MMTANEFYHNKDYHPIFTMADVFKFADAYSMYQNKEIDKQNKELFSENMALGCQLAELKQRLSIPATHDFSQSKVGDMCWFIGAGYGTIIEINKEREQFTFSLSEIDFDPMGRKYSRNFDGTPFNPARNPDTFNRKPLIIEGE